MAIYLIIGNGAAANAAAETIRHIDREGSIQMFTKETFPFYYTPALPEYLSGEKQLKNLLVHDLPWYEKNRIDLHLNTEITGIDPSRKTVRTEAGDSCAFDRLLLATGAACRVPPIKGADGEGVFTLRTLADANAIIEKAKAAKRLVLIGGGLLGLEAGNGLRKRGLEVTVVEFFPRLLPRQTDGAGAAVLQRQMEAMGFSFRLDTRTKEIVKTGQELSVHLEDGERLPADMVLISAGVMPETALARRLGLSVGKGVRVDDALQTGIPDIYAAGDLIEHRGFYYGIWPAAMEQGRVAGANMAGQGLKYEGTVPANKLKVAGIHLFAAGDVDSAGERESLVREDEPAGVYRKLVLKDHALVGAILIGNLEGSDEILKAIKTGMDVSSLQKELAGEGFDFTKLS